MLLSKATYTKCIPEDIGTTTEHRADKIQLMLNISYP
uniref:Uncharacterized protein n=1 Tax=Anguilla anguilla TaxID=7936 RepID=A0A0E9Q334_ANGAN